jgi:hypothetical protein
MTEEVVRRFASQAEAIDYVLDHGLSRAEASYLSDEGWAIVEAKRMRRGLLQPKAAVARSRADLEGTR